MTSFRISSRLLALLSLASSLSTFVSSFGQQSHQVKFRVTGESIIVVPVTINGAGPFNFMLDTGTTNTLIDRKLAEELHLPSAGARRLAAPGKEADTFLAHADSVSMAGANVRGLDLFVINHLADGPPYVRGSLGEDFMRYFDLLVDNRHHLIQFEVGPGPLGDMLAGEQLPLTLNGSNEKEPTENRLIVVGQCIESGGREMKFQLDSGATRVMLFSGLNTRAVFSSALTHTVDGPFGLRFEANLQTAHLQLGKKVFTETVIVPESNISPRGADVDGLLPTSLFQSIFISHSGKFVILDPSANPKLAQSKPPFHADTAIPDGTSLRIPSPAPQ
jgi:predicted aspartyl protease